MTGRGGRRPEAGCTIKQFSRLNLLAYKGTSEPVEAKAWISETEVFRVIAFQEEQKLPFVTFMLEGEADL